MDLKNFSYFTREMVSRSCTLEMVSRLFASTNSEFSNYNSKFSIVNSEILIVDSKLLIVNSKFLNVNSEFLIVNSEFLIINSKFLIVNTDPVPERWYLDSVPAAAQYRGSCYWKDVVITSGEVMVCAANSALRLLSKTSKIMNNI